MKKPSAGHWYKVTLPQEAAHRRMVKCSTWASLPVCPCLIVTEAPTTSWHRTLCKGELCSQLSWSCAFRANMNDCLTIEVILSGHMALEVNDGHCSLLSSHLIFKRVRISEQLLLLSFSSCQQAFLTAVLRSLTVLTNCLEINRFGLQSGGDRWLRCRYPLLYIKFSVESDDKPKQSLGITEDFLTKPFFAT